MIHLLFALSLCIQDKPDKALDAFLDKRYDAEAGAADALAKKLKLDAAALEKLLRAGRASYPEPPQKRGELTADVPLPCEHLDHAVKYFIYVPKGYDPAKATPLLVVGHGGSSGRDLAFGARAALGGLQPWLESAEKHGYLVVAPLTDRGWGAIGNSILLSCLSKVQREYRIDPDRIYLTGHSMGGHLTWRSAMSLADRWGAVSPMSGGYDYVKDSQVFACFNVPGWATWGSKEPYQINEFNRIIKAWMEEREFPWVNHEKIGGHEIFEDEIEPICEFFDKNPRNLYRERVHARMGGKLQWDTPETNPAWKKEHTWTKGRAIPCQTVHWLRLTPLPSDTPPEKAVQEIAAANKGGNRFELTSRNARKVRIYLHPKMVDFTKSVVVMANVKKVFDKKVTPDPKLMLELVRELDDRGRIFWAAVDVEIADDAEVPEPTFKK